MKAAAEQSALNELSRVSRQRSLVFRWIVKVPVIVTMLVGAVLLLINYAYRGEETFIPPGLYIAVACFSVFTLSVGVGMLLAFVLCRFDKNREY